VTGTHTPITRKMVREAVIHAYRKVCANPNRPTLTRGQVEHMIQQREKKR
jgi:hypothetical protein